MEAWFRPVGLSGEHQAHAGEVKRLGDNPVVVEFTADGAKIEVAAKTEHRALVNGPLMTTPAPAAFPCLIPKSSHWDDETRLTPLLPWLLTVGILRGRRDDGDTRRFQMRQKLASIGDDFWIEDDQGNRVYRVDGKAMRIRDTFVLEDASGHEVAKIQERKLSIRDKVAIERDGRTVATVHKALIGIRDRFMIDLEDGPELKAKGNILDHEYEIERDGDTVARISKKWFRVRETYGVEIGTGEDEALVLAAVVAIESLTS